MADASPGAGQGVNRVNRGGSWNNNAANCRAANRNNNEPGNRNNNLGFRPAPAPPAPESAEIRLDGTGQRPRPTVMWANLNGTAGRW